MKYYTAAILMMLVLPLPAGANQLANPGFEIPHDTEDRAASWSGNETGGMWGNALRTNWKSHKGSFAAAIRGSWSGQDNGGFWQACSVSAARTYVLTGYLYWDNEWSAEKIEWRIEWYSGDELLLVDRQQISEIPEARWTLRSFPVKAPAQADKAHFVFDVSGTSSEGVLYVDEIDFDQH